MMQYRLIQGPDHDQVMDMIDNFFHEYYYSLSCDCTDGTVIVSDIGHYREVMKEFEKYKQVVYYLGGGTITLLRHEDKILDEDSEAIVDMIMEVFDDTPDDQEVIVQLNF